MQVCNCIQYLQSTNCLCGLQQYVVDPKTATYNYMSYGAIQGHYYIADANILYDFIINSDYAKLYKFIDIRSPFYKFYMDIDMQILKTYKHIAWDDLKDFIFQTIFEVLRYNVLDKTVKSYMYICATKGDLVEARSGGIHLYFPYIIVDNWIALELTDRIIRQLTKKNIFKGLNAKAYASIIDRAIYSTQRPNGLQMLFQYDEHGMCYKINPRWSTYTAADDHIDQLISVTWHLCDATTSDSEKNEPTTGDELTVDGDNQLTVIQQLQLTCLKTTATAANIKLKPNTSTAVLKFTG